MAVPSGDYLITTPLTERAPDRSGAQTTVEGRTWLGAKKNLMPSISRPWRPPL